MIPNPQAVLQFGSLELARGDASTPYSLFAAGDDGSWGNPDPVIAVVDSLLGDGQLASVVRHNNREAQFGITVSAADGTALAAAEAALVAETEKQNVLVWSAPDGYAPTTVFDVVTSWLEHVFDDVEELQLQRRYVLHLTLFPSSRSSTSTAVEALGSGIDPTVPPVTVTVTDCNSLTGWTARPVVSGHVGALVMGSTGTYIRQDADWGYDLWAKFDTGAVQDWTATPYITVDWKADSGDDARPISGYVSGPSLAETGMTKVSETTSPLGSGYTRTTWVIPAADLALVRYVKFYKGNDLTQGWQAMHFNPDPQWTLRISRVAVTDGGAVGDGTSRQLSRFLTIGGSARAMGVIDVHHDSALGDVLVWSGPAACSPPLRAVRSAGAGQVVDAGLVSGAHEDIDTTPFTADVPLGTLPSGAYMVMARVTSLTTPGDHAVDVTAQTYLQTDDTPTYVAVGTALTLNDALLDGLSVGTYKVVPLGVMHLPASEVSTGSNGFLRVTLLGTDVRLDEAWLFNITDGDLTFVKDADKVLRITSPTLLDPRWRVWTGPTDTAMYDAGSKMEIRGQHLFAPGSWAAFTVTTNAQDAAVSLTYDKRWHTHAGEDG